MNLENEFVPYEQALVLKELGFDEECFLYIYTGDTGNNVDHIIETKPSLAKNHNLDSLCISKPTFSQSFRWFREKYNLLVSPKINEFHDRFYFTIRATEPRLMKEIILKREINYEEAELECLKKLILL